MVDRDTEAQPEVADGKPVTLEQPRLRWYRGVYLAREVGHCSGCGGVALWHPYHDGLGGELIDKCTCRE